MTEGNENIEVTFEPPLVQPSIPEFPVDRIELNDIPIPKFPDDRIEKGENLANFIKSSKWSR